MILSVITIKFLPHFVPGRPFEFWAKHLQSCSGEILWKKDEEDGKSSKPPLWFHSLGTSCSTPLTLPSNNPSGMNFGLQASSWSTGRSPSWRSKEWPDAELASHLQTGLLTRVEFSPWLGWFAQWSQRWDQMGWVTWTLGQSCLNLHTSLVSSCQGHPSFLRQTWWGRGLSSIWCQHQWWSS